MYCFIAFLIPLLLSIIAGKPGSGKTCHMSTLLVDMLTDWVRYEIKHWDEEKQEYVCGEVYPSSIWTNIVFNIEGLNETIGKRIGQEVDVSKYMNYCDDSFFHDPGCIYWWKKFPARAVVIIDEVHFYLGRKVEFGSLDLETELINWISTHRHTQQELYFLSQHTDQFANQVLGVADLLLEIVNLKSLSLPFPFSVPMSDIDELKRSFGITTQYYQANKGNFRGKAVRWSGAVDRHMMSGDIYRVYKSHDAGVEASDRPSLKMRPLEGVLWFARRHAWHLIPKAVVTLGIPFVGVPLLFGLPLAVMKGAQVDKQVVQLETKESKDESKGQAGRVAMGEPREPSKQDVRLVPSPETRSFGADPRVVEGIESSVVERVESGRIESKREVKIVMLYQKGVLLDDGRKIAIGETFDYAGETETLVVACAACGVIVFESGKRIKF
jgi:hypothetical protein